MKTDYGENVLILGDAALAATTVESGSRVSLEGAWMSRGAGAVRVFSGTPVAKSQYCFVGATINTTTPGPGAATAASAQAVACECVRSVVWDYLTARHSARSCMSCSCVLCGGVLWLSPHPHCRRLFVPLSCRRRPGAAGHGPSDAGHAAPGRRGAPGPARRPRRR